MDFQKEIRDLKTQINFAINLSENVSENTNKILKETSDQLNYIKEYLITYSIRSTIERFN
jgi:hypothetical protein